MSSVTGYNKKEMRQEKYQSCISICLESATVCNLAAFECMKELEVKLLSRCVQLQRECAEMCLSTARILTLGSAHARDVCIVCADYCMRCALECEKHMHIDYCRRCAEICRRCMEECYTTIREHIQ